MVSISTVIDNHLSSFNSFQSLLTGSHRTSGFWSHFSRVGDNSLLRVTLWETLLDQNEETLITNYSSYSASGNHKKSSYLIYCLYNVTLTHMYNAHTYEELALWWRRFGGHRFVTSWRARKADGVSLGLKAKKLRLYQGLIPLEASISPSLYKGQPFYSI